MADKMLCSNTAATAQHDTKDAAEFQECEYRSEAESIVNKKLSENPIEALELFTDSDASYEITLGAVRQLIQQDETLMNRFITTALKTHEEEIQEKLERANA